MKNFNKTTNFSPTAQQPNSPTAQQPNSPTAQQSKLNFKWLLSFCLIFLLSLSSNSLLAQPITFTFDASDDSQSTITKTVSGVTMTLSNEQPDNNFSYGNFSQGLLILSTGTYLVSSLEIRFSSTVQIISYNFKDGFSLEGNESFVLADGSSTSTENSPFTNGVRNFSNQFTVPANTPITLTGNPVDSSSDYMYLNDFTVQPLSSNPVAEVPTLSEWGLIILALLLMTLGTLYLVQPSVWSRLEQEG